MEHQTKRTTRRVKSPCIGTCLYDPVENACLGCKRTPAEITNWITMTEDEKYEAIKRIQAQDRRNG
jgi:predicted Fe-S protein YdhL (DUF1289 family)